MPRYLKQLVSGRGNEFDIGVFENGDRVQELFLVRPKSGPCATLTCVEGNGDTVTIPTEPIEKYHMGFEVLDPEKKLWVEFKQFQKSGP